VRRANARVWIAVAVGGALGALARWLVAEVVLDAELGEFPWGTLLVNVLGCALIGVLAPVLATRARWVVGLGITGFLGGFTTYSAFAEETFALADRGDITGVVLAGAYVVATIVATAVAVAVGSRLAANLRGSAHA
jgi:CrcB protein